MLKKVAEKRILIISVMGAITAVLAILFAIFGKGDEKVKLLVLTLVLPAVVFGFFVLLWKVLVRFVHPSRAVLSAFAAFFLAAGLLGFAVMIVHTLANFPDGYTPSVGIGASIVACALIQIKRLN